MAPIVRWKLPVRHGKGSSMGMLLLLVGLAVVVTAMQVVALTYLWRESMPAEPPPHTLPHVTPSPQFFGASPVSPDRDAAIAHLLRHLEQHIRLEQEVAESYHLAPTTDLLHRHTASPLVLH